MREALTGVLLPVIVVAGLGALLASRMPIDQDTVSRITLYLLSPALVGDTVLHTPIQMTEALRLSAAYVLVLVVSLVIGWICGIGARSTSTRSLSISVGLWNAGNMGLPIALFAFGQAGFERATILFLVSFIGMYAVGPAVLTLGRDGITVAGTIRAVMRLPVLWVAAVALVVRAVDAPVPQGVDRGIRLMAQATLPMILLALGLQLGAGGWVRPTARVWAATAGRLVVGPLAAWGLGWLIGLRGESLSVVVLSAAMPTAVNTILIAREYEGDTELVASAVVTTTLLSIPTLVVLLALL